MVLTEFRAKTASTVRGFEDIDKPNGIWVYGFYRDKIGLPVISEFSAKYCDYVDYEIDKNTLGQWTGLYDVNHNKIYTGDIFVPCYICPVDDKITEDLDYERQGEVQIINGQTRLTTGAFWQPLTNLCHMIHGEEYYLNYGIPYDYESAIASGMVIGNIYDKESK